jgi:site-specific DNA recombinase
MLDAMNGNGKAADLRELADLAPTVLHDPALGGIALYCRVSSEDQRERKTITTQKELGRFHCASRQLPEPEVYADDGVSGTVPFAKRDGGGRLLKDAREGRIRMVIVYRIDRLGRKLLDVLSTIQQLQELGVAVVSINEPFDTSTPMGRAMLSIMCVFAELERETIQQRTQDGLGRVLRDGTYCGAYAPLGYRKIGEKSASRLEPDEAPIPGFDFSPAELVRRIFRWAALEGVSARGIARRLTEEGAPTPAALNRKNWKDRLGHWHTGSVTILLQNTDYKGLHSYGAQTARGKREEPVAQQIPAIVTGEVWGAAQEALKTNRARFVPPAKHQYLLRGLMQCAGCGAVYQATMSGRKRDLLYYGCGRRQNRRGCLPGTCSNPHMRGEELEAAIWADCLGFIRNPGSVLEELAALHSSEGERLEAIHEDIARRTRALETLAKQRNNVITLRARDLIDDAEMEAQRGRLLLEEEGEHATMERLRERLRVAQAAQVSLEAVEDLLRDLNRKNDEPWTFEEKRHVITMLVSSMVVEKGEDGEPLVRVQYCFRPAFQAVSNTPCDTWR